MAEAQKPQGHHSLHIEDRGTLRATGVSRVDFFSDELITAQTALGELHIKGEGLHIEKLSLDGGDLKVEGKIDALSYEERTERNVGGFFSRLLR